MKVAAGWSLILMFGLAGWMEPVAPTKAVASALELEGQSWPWTERR